MGTIATNRNSLKFLIGVRHVDFVAAIEKQSAYRDSSFRIILHDSRRFAHINVPSCDDQLSNNARVR